MLLVSKLFAISDILADMFDDCVVKTISSDAKSREEQDGSKQSLVGEVLMFYHLKTRRYVNTVHI